MAAAGTAQAHSVSVSRGTVIVGSEMLRVELGIPISDLLHYCRPEIDDTERLAADALDDCIRRYELQVLKHFVIRDAAGRRLDGRITSCAHSLSRASEYEYAALRAARADYRLEYHWSEPPAYLTFQQTFFSDGPSHAAQLVLDVRVDDDQPGCIVQLTNRGNAETVEVHWDKAHGDAARIDAPPRFRSVAGQLNIEPNLVQLEIALPLALAETWTPVARRDPDFVSVDEWSAAKEDFARLFATSAALRINGQPAVPAAIAVRLLGPEDPAVGAADSQGPLSSWAARVGATLKFTTDSAPRDVLLNWQLFNAAVLEADVTCVDGDRTMIHRVTPYEATVRWTAQAPHGGGG